MEPRKKVRIALKGDIQSNHLLLLVGFFFVTASKSPEKYKERTRLETG